MCFSIVSTCKKHMCMYLHLHLHLYLQLLSCHLSCHWQLRRPLARDVIVITSKLCAPTHNRDAKAMLSSAQTLKFIPRICVKRNSGEQWRTFGHFVAYQEAPWSTCFSVCGLHWNFACAGTRMFHCTRKASQRFTTTLPP